MSTSLIVHVFGSSTPSGQNFLSLLSSYPYIKTVCYSRKTSFEVSPDYISRSLDLSDPSTFNPSYFKSHIPSIIVSFAPIWLLSPFLHHLFSIYGSGYFSSIKSIIACSSTSLITKRFAFNDFDKSLVETLSTAESLLENISTAFDVPIQIVRPTLIYGRCGVFVDNNLRHVARMMKIFPVIPIPRSTGLRQPIHCSQLSSVVLTLAFNFLRSSPDTCFSVLNIGGDSILSYREMLVSLRDALVLRDKSHYCLFLALPNSFFYLLFSPLLLFSPKKYEALLRVSSNLSGFATSRSITSTKLTPFPLLPLS